MSTHSVLDTLGRPHDNHRSSQKLRLVKGTTPAPISLRRKVLFEDSLLEVSNEQRRRRMWAVVFSVALESLLVAVVLLVPLWFTNVLPREALVTLLTVPPPPPAAPPPPPASSPAPKAARVTGNVVDGRLLAPINIPSKILMVREPEAPPAGGVIGGVAGGIPGGQLGGTLGAILGSSSHPVVVRGPGNPAPRRVRISQGITEGMIVSKVQPVYPVIAKAARIQGVVVLKAIIDKHGNIQNLEAASGSPYLVPAAIDAVRQWRYRPYLLNGEPVDVETTVLVTFKIE